MTTLEQLFPEANVLVLRPRDKNSALVDLANRAATLLGAQASTIAAALTAREALGSTGVGAGIALPHARCPGSTAPVALFARLERAIAWDAIDQKPVDLVVLLLSPNEPADLHLKVLATISRRLRDANVAAALRVANDVKDIRQILIG
jgi:PTS system nitrogen regulatory IIA component